MDNTEITEFAIIGGTGLTGLDGFEINHRQVIQTPYGEMSSPITQGRYAGKSVAFLARHGANHTIPPHMINYRANIWGLHKLGVKKILAFAAVGGINPVMKPSDLVIPDQIVDYTWGRSQTFFEEDLNHVTHIDFTAPYCETLRNAMLQAGQQLDCAVHTQGVYAATQGPRLESAAEINRLEKDGCDIVGMTGMPEAALARELELCYACCAIIANEAAGRGPAEITMADIEANLKVGVQNALALLAAVIPQ